MTDELSTSPPSSTEPNRRREVSDQSDQVEPNPFIAAMVLAGILALGALTFWVCYLIA
jgi:hypothetical protein